MIVETELAQGVVISIPEMSVSSRLVIGFVLEICSFLSGSPDGFREQVRSEVADPLKDAMQSVLSGRLDDAAKQIGVAEAVLHQTTVESEIVRRAKECVYRANNREG